MEADPPPPFPSQLSPSLNPPPHPDEHNNGHHDPPDSPKNLIIHSCHHIPSPEFVPPIRATSIEQLPEGPEWIYEAKWDGYRPLRPSMAMTFGCFRSRIKTRARWKRPLPRIRTSSAWKRRASGCCRRS